MVGVLFVKKNRKSIITVIVVNRAMDIIEKDEVNRILKKSPSSRELTKLLDYYEAIYETPICRSCTGDINQALTTLKRDMKTTKYEFKKLNGIYRLGKNRTISNRNLTDELAEEFLRENPNRIKRFYRYDEDFYNSLVSKEEEDTPQVPEKVNNYDYLMSKKLPELRELFPTVKAISKKDFVNKVLNI